MAKKNCQPSAHGEEEAPDDTPTEAGALTALRVERGAASTAALARTERVSQLPLPKAIGPRTREGKQRSKLNALKHGIFSATVVLRGEPRPVYSTLLMRLHDHFQPEGAMEELLVEKLTMLLWRYRRLLVAEGAEIRKALAFLEWDQGSRQEKEGAEMLQRSFFFHGGLVSQIENPRILDECISLLTALRDDIKESGLDKDRDFAVLARVYGMRDLDKFQDNLFMNNDEWWYIAEASEEERKSEGYASPDECKRIVLKAVKKWNN